MKINNIIDLLYFSLNSQEIRDGELATAPYIMFSFIIIMQKSINIFPRYEVSHSISFWVLWKTITGFEKRVLPQHLTVTVNIWQLKEQLNIIRWQLKKKDKSCRASRHYRRVGNLVWFTFFPWIWTIFASVVATMILSSQKWLLVLHVFREIRDN